jgi:hypothetical protein
MARVAQLMPTLLEQMNAAGDDNAKYEAVLDADRRMRQLVGTLPAAVLRAQDATEESNTPWLFTARRTFAISAADKVRWTVCAMSKFPYADISNVDNNG